MQIFMKSQSLLFLEVVGGGGGARGEECGEAGGCGGGGKWGTKKTCFEMWSAKILPSMPSVNLVEFHKETCVPKADNTRAKSGLNACSSHLPGSYHSFLY